MVRLIILLIDFFTEFFEGFLNLIFCSLFYALLLLFCLSFLSQSLFFLILFLFLFLFSLTASNQFDLTKLCTTWATIGFHFDKELTCEEIVIDFPLFPLPALIPDDELVLSNIIKWDSIAIFVDSVDFKFNWVTVRTIVSRFESEFG